jgi:hypothetical protein
MTMKIFEIAILVLGYCLPTASCRNGNTDNGKPGEPPVEILLAGNDYTLAFREMKVRNIK